MEAWFYINKMFIYTINFNSFIDLFTLGTLFSLFYNFQDANCGNTLLISLDELVKDGLLTKDELPKPV